MSELREIKSVFLGLRTLYQTYFPKVDPNLVHSLLMSIEENPEKVPFYMVEIFTKPGTDAEKMRDYIMQKTGMVPSIHDNGTHYVVNQRLRLGIPQRIVKLRRSHRYCWRLHWWCNRERGFTRTERYKRVNLSSILRI